MSAENNHVSDELLDELFSIMTLLVRAVGKQHAHAEEMRLGVSRMLLLRMVAESGVCRAGDISNLLCIKPPATSSLLDGLEREGLVVREHSEVDKRVVNISLTEAGHDALAIADRERRAFMRDKLAVLTDDDIKTLIRIQRQLAYAMSAGTE